MADFGDASAAVAGNGVDSADKRPADVASPPSTTSAAAPLPARRTVKRSISTKKETMNGPLYMQASNKAVIVRRVKRKGDSPWRQLMRWFVENQIGTCDKAMDPKSPMTDLSLKPWLRHRAPVNLDVSF